MRAATIKWALGSAASDHTPQGGSHTWRGNHELSPLACLGALQGGRNRREIVGARIDIFMERVAHALALAGRCGSSPCSQRPKGAASGGSPPLPGLAIFGVLLFCVGAPLIDAQAIRSVLLGKAEHEPVTFQTLIEKRDYAV